MEIYNYSISQIQNHALIQLCAINLVYKVSLSKVKIVNFYFMIIFQPRLLLQ